MEQEVYEVVWNGQIEREHAEKQRREPGQTRGTTSVVVGPSGASLKGLETQLACQAAGCHHVAKARMHYSSGVEGPLYCWSCGDRALTRSAKAFENKKRPADVVADNHEAQ